MAFLGKIDFKDLSETEKVIYAYLRENFEKIPYIHMRDIALNAHAGTSSVMRLIHKMGYKSYYDFQEFVSNQQKKVAVDNGTFDLLSVDNYPADMLDKCHLLAQEIAKADSIVFLGLGTSGTICQYARRRFCTLEYNATSMVDATFPIYSRFKSSKNNLIIALSISGETNEILEILQSVKDSQKAKIFSITPNKDSHIAKLSEISINYKVAENRVNLYGDLTSQLPTVFIIETLSRMVQDLAQD